MGIYRSDTCVFISSGRKLEAKYRKDIVNGAPAGSETYNFRGTSMVIVTDTPFTQGRVQLS